VLYAAAPRALAGNVVIQASAESVGWSIISFAPRCVAVWRAYRAALAGWYSYPGRNGADGSEAISLAS
jgi:hypothetical protein